MTRALLAYFHSRIRFGIRTSASRLTAYTEKTQTSHVRNCAIKGAVQLTASHFLTAANDRRHMRPSERLWSNLKSPQLRRRKFRCSNSHLVSEVERRVSAPRVTIRRASGQFHSAGF